MSRAHPNRKERTRCHAGISQLRGPDTSICETGTSSASAMQDTKNSKTSDRPTSRVAKGDQKPRCGHPKWFHFNRHLKGHYVTAKGCHFNGLRGLVSPTIHVRLVRCHANICLGSNILGYCSAKQHFLPGLPELSSIK